MQETFQQIECPLAFSTDYMAGAGGDTGGEGEQAKHLDQLLHQVDVILVAGGADNVRDRGGGVSPISLSSSGPS